MIIIWKLIDEKRKSFNPDKPYLNFSGGGGGRLFPKIINIGANKILTLPLKTLF